MKSIKQQLIERGFLFIGLTAAFYFIHILSYQVEKRRKINIG